MEINFTKVIPPFFHMDANANQARTPASRKRGRSQCADLDLEFSLQNVIFEKCTNQDFEFDGAYMSKVIKPSLFGSASKRKPVGFCHETTATSSCGVPDSDCSNSAFDDEMQDLEPDSPVKSASKARQLPCLEDYVSPETMVKMEIADKTLRENVC